MSAGIAEGPTLAPLTAWATTCCAAQASSFARQRIFGSVARGDEHPVSDIDFMVKFERGSSLFDLMDLEAELAELLGVRVDVISAGGLKDRDEHIRDEAVSLA